MRRRAAAGVVSLLCCMPAGVVQGRVFMTQEQALAAAFPPPAAVERRTLYLTETQAAQAARRAGVPVEVRVVPYYVGHRDQRIVGYAYFDTHLVRTLPETILVLVSPAGRIVRIDILSFDEPEDYMLSERWLQQFPEKHLDDDLSLQRGIRAMSGATLSARAVTAAARRVLALHDLFVAPAPAPHAAPSGGGTP
jgi:FMN-binding domain